MAPGTSRRGGRGAGLLWRAHRVRAGQLGGPRHGDTPVRVRSDGRRLRRCGPRTLAGPGSSTCRSRTTRGRRRQVLAGPAPPGPSGMDGVHGPPDLVPAIGVLSGHPAAPSTAPDVDRRPGPGSPGGSAVRPDRRAAGRDHRRRCPGSAPGPILGRHRLSRSRRRGAGPPDGSAGGMVSGQRPSSYAGAGAAPGRAAGTAFILASDGGAGDVPPGAILVARLIHPFHAPLFLRVAAVVAEEGGLLQHTATLAREFGIPAVVGLPEATTIFHTGERLE